MGDASEPPRPDLPSCRCVSAETRDTFFATGINRSDRAQIFYKRWSRPAAAFPDVGARERAWRHHYGIASARTGARNNARAPFCERERTDGHQKIPSGHSKTNSDLGRHGAPW